MAPTPAPNPTSAARPICAAASSACLQPSPRHPRRLHLAGLVRRIEWRLTGSEFESLLVQFELLQKVYGAKCLGAHASAPSGLRALSRRQSLPAHRCHAPAQPARGRLGLRTVPFARRRRTIFRRSAQALSPAPLHLRSHARPQLSRLRLLRDEDVPRALLQGLHATSATPKNPRPSKVFSPRAAKAVSSRSAPSATRPRPISNSNLPPRLHAQVQRVEDVRSLAAEIVRPLSRLRAVILQASANPGEVAVFLFENGRLRGPAAFSTLGMRIQNEQSGSTSLFAQPLAIEPVPEEQGPGDRDQGSEAERGNQGPRE